jgi:hypothetical protein
VLQVDVNVWSLLAQAAMLALSSLSLSLLSPVLNKDQGTALQKLCPFGHIAEIVSVWAHPNWRVLSR